MNVTRSPAFWLPAILTMIVGGAFFAWELSLLPPIIPRLPRPVAGQEELLFTIVLIVLLGVDAGLWNWRRSHGSCPRGTRRATGVAGFVGAVTLLCPACLLLPTGIVGAGFALAIIGPFLPLLRIIALVLLVAAAWVLWPRKHMR